ncbi:MAG: TPM domain-containing protein [Desulfobulbus sp.]|jgi:uncharacterized protein|uniref:TPM domain-containing protein n=1 Tax=Desulfobulbus sp. TaxID=895 RepID=UPI00283B03F0|nr:TPM domain-containing protein [Desulfobulbus sp.]MDR2551041.1 TPM domain-containing protein [Desulfobulbus sp.]
MAAFRLHGPLLTLCLLVLLLGGLAVPAWALEVPPLAGRVNDTAHVLSVATIDLLDRSLAELARSESTQIVVLTVPSLEGESLEQYSLKVAEAWKIGQKGLDNGALLLVAVADRKIRIETGYGLEGKLTDLVAGRIIREKIVPAFKRGAFDQGVIDGVSAMVAAVKGEYAGKGGLERQHRDQDYGPYFIVLMFGLILIGKLFRRVKPLAIGLGGVFAPALAATLFVGLFGWLILLALVPLGMLGGLLASLLAAGGGRRGSYPGGFIGGFGGGSFGGGGSFSGGGGGFGGGGASGGW